MARTLHDRIGVNYVAKWPLRPLRASRSIIHKHRQLSIVARMAALGVGPAFSRLFTNLRGSNLPRGTHSPECDFVPNSISFLPEVLDTDINPCDHGRNRDCAPQPAKGQNR